MGLKYYHNSAGFSLGVFRNLFLYPLAFFLGYHYITDIKHFKNYHRIIQLIFFSIFLCRFLLCNALRRARKLFAIF